MKRVGNLMFVKFLQSASFFLHLIYIGIIWASQGDVFGRTVILWRFFCGLVSILPIDVCAVVKQICL